MKRELTSQELLERYICTPWESFSQSTCCARGIY
jgi:hypothetical protein